MFEEEVLKLENEKMQKILEETTDELEIFKVYGEFWDKYLKKILIHDKERGLTINYREFEREDINRLLESDALYTYCKYAIKQRHDFPKIFSALFRYFAHPFGDDTSVKRVINAMGDYILADREDDEVSNKYVAKIFDEKVVCYLEAARFRKIEVDDKVWESIRSFYNNLPKDMHFFDTEFYKKLWLERKNKDKKIYNVHPIRSKEEYEAELSKFTFDRRGMVNDNFKYDHVLAEYLLFYGNQIPYEDKERYLHIMSKNAHEGKFYETQTSRYFKDTMDGKRILDNNPFIVYNDILRSYKESCYNVTCLNSEIYRKLYIQMKMYYKDYISNLAQYGEQAVEFARYLKEANGAHYFTRRYNVLDNFKNQNDVIDIEMFLRGTYLYNLLVKNFNDDKLYDYTVHEDGLTNFDYADMAFGLIAKDKYAGIRELNDEGTKRLYERHGRDVRDSRALRQVVDSYITSSDISKGHADENLKDKCVEFVNYVSRKPDFDLYSNRECSDFIQISKRTDNEFAKYLENEIIRAMMENPEYSQMSLDEAKGYAYNFMNNVGDRPIGQEMEDDFNKFLRAISIMKICDENGIVPREINEFIIRQSLTENSILNSTEERYESIFERAFENLRANESKSLIFVRDCSSFKLHEYTYSGINLIDSKTLIREILNNPEYDFIHRKDTVAPYVSQYVDLDAIEADILGKLEASRVENSELVMARAEGTDYEDR